MVNCLPGDCRAGANAASALRPLHREGQVRTVPHEVKESPRTAATPRVGRDRWGGPEPGFRLRCRGHLLSGRTGWPSASWMASPWSRGLSMFWKRWTSHPFQRSNATERDKFLAFVESRTASSTQHVACYQGGRWNRLPSGRLSYRSGSGCPSRLVSLIGTFADPSGGFPRGFWNSFRNPDG
jgi:hypothetical protein